MLKLNKLVVAMATAFTAVTAFAAPVTPTDIQNAGANLQQAWITGASAPSYNVFLGFAESCQNNTLSFFHAGTSDKSGGSIRPGSSDAGNHLAYACVMGGKVSVLYFTNQGGSVNAFSPHVASDLTGGTVVTNLNRLRNVASANCQTTATLNVSTKQNAVQIYKCSSATINGFSANDGTPNKPAGGFSDVEPALFGIDVSGKGTVANTGVTQVFGIIASDNLYRALQAKQGITEASGFLAEKAPNITSAQYAALISDSAAAVWGSLVPLEHESDEVIIARRVDTSGTQASSNAYFLGSPCLGNASTGGSIPPSTAAQSAPGFYTVVEGAETGNVRTTLSDANRDGKFALGVVSLENATSATTGYHYLKLNGVHPEAGPSNTTDAGARYTSAQGNYSFQIDLKAFKANTATGYAATVIDTILQGFNGVACTDLPRGLLLNSSTSACGGTENAGIYVSKVTREGNNCRPLTLKF